MIFIPITKLVNNTDKSFFVEQVQLYTKLVNAFCLKNHIENNADDKIINLVELKSIGVIEKEDDFMQALLEMSKMNYQVLKAKNNTRKRNR